MDNFQNLKRNAKSQQNKIDEYKKKGSRFYFEHLEQVSSLYAKAAYQAGDNQEASKMLKNSAVISKMIIISSDIMNVVQLKRAYHSTIEYLCQSLVYINKIEGETHKLYKTELGEKIEAQIYNFSNQLQQNQKLDQIDERMTPMNALLQAIIRANQNSPAIQFLILNLIDWATKQSEIHLKDNFNKAEAILRRQEQNSCQIMDKFNHLIQDDQNAENIMNEQKKHMISIEIQKDYKRAKSLFESDQDSNLVQSLDLMQQAICSVRHDIEKQENDSNLKELIDLEVQCQVYSSQIIILRQQMLQNKDQFFGVYDKIANSFHELQRLLVIAQGEKQELFEYQNQVNNIRNSISKEQNKILKDRETEFYKKNQSTVDWIRKEATKAISKNNKVKKWLPIYFKKLLDKFKPKNTTEKIEIPNKFKDFASCKRAAIKMQLQQHPDKNIRFDKTWIYLTGEISIKINDIIDQFNCEAGNEEKSDDKDSDETGEF